MASILRVRRFVDKSTTLPLETTAASFQTPASPESTGQAVVMNLETTDHDHDVSREDLLLRAAELGPGPRLSLDNIMMAPTDPILAAKSLPRVAQRRARLRNVVKVAVGLLAGFALFATAATALSSSKAPAAGNVAAASTHGDAPAEAVTPKEPLELAATAKAPKADPAPVAAAPIAKRGRSGKRR